MGHPGKGAGLLDHGEFWDSDWTIIILVLRRSTSGKEQVGKAS